MRFVEGCEGGLDGIGRSRRVGFEAGYGEVATQGGDLPFVLELPVAPEGGLEVVERQRVGPSEAGDLAEVFVPIGDEPSLTQLLNYTSRASWAVFQEEPRAPWRP